LPKLQVVRYNCQIARIRVADIGERRRIRLNRRKNLLTGGSRKLRWTAT
jgi:hypothetical protein